jgi:hypothetical protein
MTTTRGWFGVAVVRSDRSAADVLLKIIGCATPKHTNKTMMLQQLRQHIAMPPK